MDYRHTKLLDCTLRDGAYLVDKKFGDSAIKGIIAGLVDAHIDFIEVGFFQNEGFGEGKTVYLNSSDAKKYIPREKKGCQFTVLADYSRYNVENLDVCMGDSVDAVRECFFKHERAEALRACAVIKEKGYKVFVQPVDILGYTDRELIEFIEEVNKLEPYCLSIVDTFGSMYQEDLHRIFELINHNLVKKCKIGFHSHNNMQMSSALSQEFVRMSVGKRKVVIDGTLSGMGRGAGNTPTELIAQYLVSQCNEKYNMDAMLDVIDIYIDNIRTRCTWGYNTPYFIAGCFGAHVNNISYLKQKNSIRSKDIRYILNRVEESERKRYDYERLEATYYDYICADIDDKASIDTLNNRLAERKILILAPGKSIVKERETIKEYIRVENPVVISVNFIHDEISTDYLYFSNIKRYEYWCHYPEFNNIPQIITSNIREAAHKDNTTIVSFVKLIKCGWKHSDNSMVMLLRLLDRLNVVEIALAGFDGYSYEKDNVNYYSSNMDISLINDDYLSLNEDIHEMLEDFIATRNSKDVQIKFITNSKFERCMK